MLLRRRQCCVVELLAEAGKDVSPSREMIAMGFMVHVRCVERSMRARGATNVHSDAAFRATSHDESKFHAIGKQDASRGT